MLLYLRKYFHKGLVQALVLVTTLSLVGIGSFAAFLGMFFAESGTIFSVNGYGVTQQIFALRTATQKRFLDFYQEQLGALAPRLLAQYGLSMSAEKNAYQKIVSELVLASMVKKAGLKISDQALSRRLHTPALLTEIFGSQLPRSLYDRKGKIQIEFLSKFLALQRLSLDDLEQMLEVASEQDLALAIIDLGMPVTKKEIALLARKKYATRTFKLVEYSLGGYLKKAEEKEATAEELAAFFAAQNAKYRAYWTEEKRAGLMWKVPLKGKSEDEKKELTQEAQQSLDDQTTFDNFIEKNKGVRSVIALQSLQTKNNDKLLFRLDLEKKGLYEEKDFLIIVMPTQIQESVERPLNEVQAAVKKDFYTDLAKKELVSDLEKLSIPDAYKLGSREIVLKSDNQSEIMEKLAKESIATDRMNNMATEGAVLKGVTDNGGYTITLESIKNDTDLTNAELFALKQEILREGKRLVQSASVDYLLKNAKIKGNKVVETP